MFVVQYCIKNNCSKDLFIHFGKIKVIPLGS